MIEIPPEIMTWSAALAANAEPHGLRVLERLKEDPRACEAMDAICGGDSAANRALLFTCMAAELLARTFNRRVSEERRTKERIRRLRTQLGELRAFCDELEQPPDLVQAYVAISEQQKTAVRNSLLLFEGIIAAREETVERNLLLWSITRKSGSANREAAELAAIGWIAAQVHHTAGQPMAKEVAVLAEAALGIRDVSVDRVHRGFKNTERVRKYVEGLRFRAPNTSPIRH
jgi:hypothetical protein